MTNGEYISMALIVLITFIANKVDADSVSSESDTPNTFGNANATADGDSVDVNGVSIIGMYDIALSTCILTFLITCCLIVTWFYSRKFNDSPPSYTQSILTGETLEIGSTQIVGGMSSELTSIERDVEQTSSCTGMSGTDDGYSHQSGLTSTEREDKAPAQPHPI
jgi:hypothetical protein